MKKRVLALVMASLLALPLVGCGGGAVLSNDYIRISQYKGLEIERVTATEITDDLLDRMIDAQLQQESVETPITDRPVQDGDMVNINYIGTVDGLPFEGGTADNVDLIIGSNQFIGPEGDFQGFEQQIIGHSVGDNFDIQIQFPDPYFSEELAGAVATFNITINEIFQVQEAIADDAWIASHSDTATTMAEFREELRIQQEAISAESVTAQYQSAVMRALMDNVEVRRFPEGVIDAEVAMMTEYYQGLADTYGMDFEDFLIQFLGITEEDFHDQVGDVAEQAVAERLAVQLIADHENLNLTEAEYAERIAEFAQRGGFEDIDSYIEQFGADLINSTILRMVVADWLVEHATLVDHINVPEVTEHVDEEVHDPAFD